MRRKVWRGKESARGGGGEGGGEKQTKKTKKTTSGRAGGRLNRKCGDDDDEAQCTHTHTHTCGVCASQRASEEGREGACTKERRG